MRIASRALFTAVVLVLTLGVGAPAQAAKTHPVPIKGTLTGTETVYPAGTWDYLGYFYTTETDFNVGGVNYKCSKPAHELVVGTLTGTVSHLGNVTREMSYCGVWEGEQYHIFDFVQELIAANGDTLNLGQGPASLEGYDPVDFTVETPITGGTGRFADASGSLNEIGRVYASWWPTGFGADPWTATGSEPWVKELSLKYTRDSHISYDASNRADK